MENNLRRYSVQLSFEEVRLPPFDDILILGKKCPQGRYGVFRSCDLLIPNEFDALEVDDPNIETVFINKRVLKKMDPEKVLSILREKVFSSVSEWEIIKVDFNLRVYYDPIEVEF